MSSTSPTSYGTIQNFIHAVSRPDTTSFVAAGTLPPNPDDTKDTPFTLSADELRVRTPQVTRDYFLSANYIGSLIAIGLAGMAGIGAFSLIAPILDSVNHSIGPDSNIIWVSLSSNLAQAVVLTMNGRLSDMFGRRYFQITGTVLALAGCIVAATAATVDVLIGANVLIGLGSATQVSFPYLLAELVPMHYRYFASSYIYALLVPVSGLAPVVAAALVTTTPGGWRSCYYVLIAINALALFFWIRFYHTPSWDDIAVEMFSQSKSKRDMLLEVDYGGLFLLASGLLLFLLGISWGGSLYAWKSAEVISTIVLGCALLVCFAFYEHWCPTSQPLVPPVLFRNVGWVAVVLTLSMAASMYYAFSIVFPTQVAVLYSSEMQASQGWLKCVITGPPLLGQIVASLFATRLGKIKWQLVTAATCGSALYAAAACVNTENRDTVLALLCSGGFALGCVDALCLTSLSVTLEDQRMIGTGVGIATSLRTFISTSAAAVFTTVLKNRLATTVPQFVAPALTDAGLPATSILEFIRLLREDQDSLGLVPGSNATIVAAGREAFKVANAHAYSTVYLTTLGFSGLGILASLLTPEIESRLQDTVGCTLHI